MLKVAIIGLGTVSPIHIQAILSLAAEGRIKLVGGCDINPARAAGLPAGVPFYNDFEELLDEARPDAVHSCLPHYLHGPVGRRILEAGCHLFTEKPLCHTLADAEALTDAAAARPDLVAAVCFQNRLNPCSQELLRRLRAGTDGPVRNIRGHVYWDRDRQYYAAAEWRGRIRTAGGGTLINQAIHTLDLMQYFVGAIPQELSAVTCRLGEPIPGVDVEDTAAVSMEFPGGIHGFYTSTNVAGANYPVEIFVQCAEADYFLRGTELRREPHDGEAHEQACVARDETFASEKFYYGMSHGLMIRAFYDAVEGKPDAPIVPLSEGLASLRMIDAIFRSSLSRCRVEV